MRLHAWIGPCDPNNPATLPRTLMREAETYDEAKSAIEAEVGPDEQLLNLRESL